MQYSAWQLHLGFLLLSLLTFFAVLAYFSHKSNPKHVAATIQRSVIESGQELKIKSAGIEKLIQQNSSTINIVLRDFIAEEGLGLFIYESDSLVFWNTNAIALPEPGEMGKNGFIALSNGYYLIERSSIAHFDVFLLSLIKHNFPYRNAYLRNEFSPDFNISANVVIHTDVGEGHFKIYDAEGAPLFSLTVHETTSLSLELALVLFLLWLVVQVFLQSLVVALHRHIEHHISSATLRFVFVGFDLLLIRLVQRWFQIPSILHDTGLFSASFFSSGNLLPNFGELVLSALSLLFLAIQFFRIFGSQRYYSNARKDQTVWKFLYANLMFALIFLLYVFSVEALLMHSAIPLSFAELYKLNTLSYLSFFVISSFTLTVFLLSFPLIRNALPTNRSIFTKIVASLLPALIVWYFASPFLINDGIILLLPLFTWLYLFDFKKQSDGRINRRFFVLPVVLFSAILTLTFYGINKQKSDQELKLTAFKLAVDADPVFEFLYADTKLALANDSIILGVLNDERFVPDQAASLLMPYITNEYFTGYFERFDLMLTVCDKDEMLNIQPENYLISCFDYFEEMTKTLGEETPTAGLFLVQDNLQGTYYISVLEFKLNDSQGEIIRIYLEFYHKFIPEGLGYPELLVDEDRGIAQDLTKFSFARYANGVLNYKFGNYLYPTRLSGIESETELFDMNGFRHYRHKVSNENELVVSIRSKGIIDALAPFPYFFVFISLLGFAVFFIAFRPWFFTGDRLSFRMRLQSMIVGTLLFSFVVIGLSTVLYIRNIYAQKNKDMLTEKTQSILIEIEHKLKDQDIHAEGMAPYLYQLLVKFSLVFYSDINMYDLSGRLLASSRPEIFERGLVSTLMQPEAYHKMAHKDKLIFVQQERIGSGTYLSSYIPFSNSKGEHVAYINLPYFARESELRNEISSFVLTYINIFFLLTGLTIVTALLLSRKLTQPLVMIQEKMKSVRFGSPNEKIDWDQHDEIGQLIRQYNHMIDELATSAALLARSERESAWREMARQVAHEIKNPLTPMRLSVQHLLRAWQENDPEMETKLKKTAQTVIDQIDSLSQIASAFSDFAKMPSAKPEFVDLVEIIQNTIGLFGGTANVRFSFDNKLKEKATVFADPKNLGRAFNNLIKNAIQAIEKGREGQVDFTLDRLLDNYRIMVSDNGKGMTTEQAAKIFTPYFTTKSSGMGIGLSIVYNIITGSGGTITFETAPGKGTTFTVLLPKAMMDKQASAVRN